MKIILLLLIIGITVLIAIFPEIAWKLRNSLHTYGGEPTKLSLMAIRITSILLAALAAVFLIQEILQ